MCVAIHKPVTLHITKWQLHMAYKSNPDGCGFAAIVDDKLIVKKGVWSFNQFWKHWAPYQDCQAIIHFRLATHGAVTDENCHPFSTEDVAFIHNGIFTGMGSHITSDTQEMWDTVVAPLAHTHADVWFSDAIKGIAREAFGSYNKVVLMHRDGRVATFGQGVEVDGVWWSNRSFLQPVRKVVDTYWKEWQSRYSTVSVLSNHTQTMTRALTRTVTPGETQCTFCDLSESAGSIQWVLMCRACQEETLQQAYHIYKPLEKPPECAGCDYVGPLDMTGLCKECLDIIA
jgi:hypothetical protein